MWLSTLTIAPIRSILLPKRYLSEYKYESETHRSIRGGDETSG